MENITQNVDFSKYSNVFCDSMEALEWAYKQGLPYDAMVRTSSPAMLWSKNPYIVHIESCWDVGRMRKFQETIKSFSEEVYDNIISVKNVTHEESLCVTQATVFFHRLLFKAACLTEEDLVEPRLFIRVEGDGGPGGNRMNSPWDKLLINNSKYRTVTYTLNNDKWNILTTKGVSLLNRIRIGGVETLIYRILIKFMSKFPNNFFRKQVLIYNESDLLIETATALALNGIQIREIKPNIENIILTNKDQLSAIKKSIFFTVNRRIKGWVEHDLVSQCEEILFQNIEDRLNYFLKLREQWKYLLNESKQNKKVLLINASGSIKGLAISSICRESGIAVVSTQHGVTKEICATHGEVSILNEINASDIFLTFNSQCKKISELSHFLRGTAYSVGISARHLRTGMPRFVQNNDNAPIAYISTNLYRGNLGVFNTWETDYDRAKNEHFLINNVFGRLPHKVLYKPYPEENRRYADLDPIVRTVLTKENIDLFNTKVDMRYLLDRHRILVTSEATSTVSWLAISGKPVVFINHKNTSPLTKSAYNSFSKGLFLFDDKKGFHEKLRNFLSLPIDEIEKLWEKKKDDRKHMINQFFTSSCNKDAGRVAAKIILNKYF